jgi:predicted signal transduction protein with EAL and GGDEF domain
VLNETGLEPQRLELEITEGIILQNTDAVLDTLTRLDQLGVSTPWTIRHRLFEPFLPHLLPGREDQDRALLHRYARHQPTDSAIVSSIVGLGQSLSVTITAEGGGDGRPSREAEEVGLRPGAGLLLRQARH